MTFARIRPGGWAIGEKVTPAQIKQLDADHSAAVDVVQMAQAIAVDPANSWITRGTPTNNLERTAWSTKDQAWFAVGSSNVNHIEASADNGRTWTNLQSSMADTLTHLDVACSTGGTVVVLAVGSRIEVSSRSAYFTHTFAAPSVMPFSVLGGQIDYDAGGLRFVAAYRSNPGDGLRVAIALNPSAAWTSVTLPAAWTNYGGFANPVVACGGGGAVPGSPGQVVAAFPDATSHAIHILGSISGGVWFGADVLVSSAALAAGTSNIEMSRPTYDALRGEWYVTISALNPTPVTEIFRSSDLLTWTLVYTTTQIALLEVQAIAGVLFGIEYRGRTVYSTDRGVTWNHGARYGGTLARLGMRAGGGGLLALNATDKTTMQSVRVGDSGVSL